MTGIFWGDLRGLRKVKAQVDWVTELESKGQSSLSGMKLLKLTITSSAYWKEENSTI